MEKKNKVICYDLLACPQHAATDQVPALHGWVLVGMRRFKPMHVLKEKKKATEEKQKLVDTCVAHSFLHLYLLIGKNKSNRLLML